MMDAAFAAARRKLILALDTASRDSALALVDELGDLAGAFKVGLELFVAAGPSLIAELRERGLRVFLDGKFHDIPNTVARAAGEAGKLGVFMLNVHAQGGLAMMAEAASAARLAAERAGHAPPLVIAVTVLTSMGQEQMQAELNVSLPVADQVTHLAKLARQAGLDGVVSSPREVAAIKDACGGSFIAVTPGVRPSWAGGDDQVRTLTPGEAMQGGADFIVVGRPVTRAPDRRGAAMLVLEEMAAALSARS